MTLDKLAAIVVENLDFMRNEILAQMRREVREANDQLREELTAIMDAKFFAVHNRIDDILETRARSDELAATNVRVGRIEGHLGFA